MSEDILNFLFIATAVCINSVVGLIIADTLIVAFLR